ncbi:histidine kinase [Streptomyces fradiae]|uniref:histidine kinase n=1 Tax=Streptomyces fradiae TaxID=1906 RepID=UPI002943103D|nr:histidine kinase [Streptomyces fradiae]WOI58567.1 histidine kinase [Streptomyces fradiae]
MARLTGWWTRRSNPEKVELYTRWTYHGLAGVAVVVGALPALATASVVGPAGGWLFLAVLLHIVLVAVLCSWALSWQLGRRDRPNRLAAVVGALTAGACLAALLLRRRWPDVDLQMTMYVVSGLVSWGVGALALCTTRVRHMMGLSVAAVAGVAAATVLVGLPVTDTVAHTFTSGFGTLVFATTSGFSGWLLRAVWELDAAHRLQARLAVAEERLRFARDLHDVMGRNLSVIALKSELAAQLSRRGAADRAVAEMGEVQRIARESQREVREVVRGYREADLHTELEGARGVLAAAGIRCRVDLRDADAELPAAAQSALAWVVREATTNVLRHSDARHCRVTVAVAPAGGPAGGPGAGRDGGVGPDDGAGRGSRAVAMTGGEAAGAGPASVVEAASGGAGPASVTGAEPGTASGTYGGEVVLVIENDGARAAGSGGSGLAGLRERLAVLGGVLDAGPADADGRFRVTARVPLDGGDPRSAAAEPAGRGHS